MPEEYNLPETPFEPGIGDETPVTYGVLRSALSSFGQYLPLLKELAVGAGAQVFHADSSGIWLGAVLFADAPFRVDMLGALVASSATITGSITTGSGSSINADYINAGTLSADRIAAGTITGTHIAGTTITAANIVADTITATQIANSTITGGKIAGTTITGANIANSTITAGKISVTSLSAINANLGTVTAGSITGVTITGGTIRTASSGARVQMVGASPARVSWWNSVGDSVDAYLGSTAELIIEGDLGSEGRLRVHPTSGLLFSALESPPNLDRITFDEGDNYFVFHADSNSNVSILFCGRVDVNERLRFRGANTTRSYSAGFLDQFASGAGFDICYRDMRASAANWVVAWNVAPCTPIENPDPIYASKYKLQDVDDSRFKHPSQWGDFKNEVTEEEFSKLPERERERIEETPVKVHRNVVIDHRIPSGKYYPSESLTETFKGRPWIPLAEIPDRLETYGEMPYPPFEHPLAMDYEHTLNLYLLMACSYNKAMERTEELEARIKILEQQ